MSTKLVFKAIPHIRESKGHGHLCFECGNEIHSGDEYLAVSGPFDGAYSARFQHPECHDTWLVGQKALGLDIDVKVSVHVERRGRSDKLDETRGYRFTQKRYKEKKEESEEDADRDFL